MTGMSLDDCVGTFMYGLTLLVIDDDGLIFDKCDPTDLQAVGGAATLVYRIADRSETPADLALSRLCTLTAALLLAPRGPDGARIVKEWLDARAEYLALQLAGNGNKGGNIND